MLNPTKTFSFIHKQLLKGSKFEFLIDITSDRQKSVDTNSSLGNAGNEAFRRNICSRLNNWNSIKLFCAKSAPHRQTESHWQSLLKLQTIPSSADSLYHFVMNNNTNNKRTKFITKNKTTFTEINVYDFLNSYVDNKQKKADSFQRIDLMQ